MKNSFVVTTSIGGNSQSRVWHSTKPLALGHPFQWMIESTRTGIRVRDLGARVGGIRSGQVKELSFEAIERGAEIKFPKFTLSIKPMADVAPAFETSKGSTLKAFACVGTWVMESATIEGSYVARIQKRPVFALSKQGESFSIKSEVDDLKIEGNSIGFGETAVMKSTDLVFSTLYWGTYSWRFALVDSPAIKTTVAETDAEAIWFRKALRGSVVAFAAFVAMSWLWPQSEKKEEELIPPQFTKIVMMKPKPAAAPAASAESSNAPKKAEQTAIAQAFRAKALQSNLSGLLKGGMTKLLAQSDFTTGTSNDARKLFNSKSDSLRATAPNAGLGEKKNVAIGSIGGAAGAGGGKAGYTKGEHAGVSGQGQSFVSMDIAGSSVDEGLTKDQVGEVIHRHLSEIRYCYESAMLRSPDIEGKLSVNFVIGGAGKVTSTEVASSTLPDPRLDDCVLRRLVTWQFPLPRGGVDVAVSYPFIFKTLGR